MNPKYESIMDLPHRVSATRPKMAMIDRAAQFAPFAALSGYGAAVAETARLTDKRIELDENQKTTLNASLNELLRDMAAHPIITVTYFVPDEKKTGGAYVKLTDAVRKINEFERVVTMAKGTRIPIDDIIEITRIPPE